MREDFGLGVLYLMLRPVIIFVEMVLFFVILMGMPKQT